MAKRKQTFTNEPSVQVWYSNNHWTLKRLEQYLVVPGLAIEWSRHGGSPLNSKKTGTIPCYVWLYNWVKPTWGQPCGSKTRVGKIVLKFYFSWTVNSNKYAVITILSSTLLRTKKKTVKKSEIWVKFFTIDCVFYRVGDWDDLQIDPFVSLHDGFKV